MSSAGSGKVFPLAGQQLDAANPRDNVWLSASAGTGKTQVLSARVLRLLLRKGVHPSQILCLTFTKAGAAEMANRINAVLARWVRLEPDKLATELDYLGADFDAETTARARTLFASVLDCPGGGLRIDTIHAFSQWLLSNFPEEADMPPGARAMEDRERELLAREVLSDILSEAEATQDTRILDAVSLFTQRKDPDALRQWLLRCADHPEMWEGRTGWQSPMDTRVRRVLGIPTDADEGWANEALHPDLFPDGQLSQMLPLMQEWKTKTGTATAEFISVWLGLAAEDRARHVDGFFKTVLKAAGDPRKMDKPSREEPRLPEWQEEVAKAVALHKDRLALLDLAQLLTAAFEAGHAFTRRWEDAKRDEGLLDFSDLIRKAAHLLKSNIASDWIRYKLDREFDHILIDEAQDTNQSQWDIVEALIDDFFSGEGAAGNKLRTIFTVGDYKQAIFGFQGTSPENYERAKIKIAKRINDAKANALEMRDNRLIPNWSELDLDRSFRTSSSVLGFVNSAIDALGHEAFGLPKKPEPHVGEERPGLVALWEVVRGETAEEEQPEGEKGWLAKHDTVLATKIAQQVHQWVKGDDPFILAKGKTPRRAGAGDIMVLVRKRRELAAQIVAQLHARGVPVAGVDRLRLGDPLAVQDLLAALRFASQPLDDLSLANLLVSPLIGWTQDDLLEFAPRDKDVRLWHHLRDCDAPLVQDTCEKLKRLLALADYETPQALIAWLLTDEWQGRARLIARLGREANDPIDELVNAAFAYESAHVPSLASFIEWFDAGTSDLKRDADEASGLVRVMTVHGSKGLQAPIVILADAAGKPGDGGDLELEDDPLGKATEDNPALKVPLPKLSAPERKGRVEEAKERSSLAEMQEHWRLLYVAMTRAEEALFIGGSLGKNEKNGPHDDSWYARLEPLFAGEPLDDPIWGGRREWGARADPIVPDGDVASPEATPTLPAWARAPIGPEPRPPRPLAPSAAGEDSGADAPSAPENAAMAARRGVLIHSLLERMPDVSPEAREEKGAAWLKRHGAELSEAERGEILASAIAVLGHPDFAAIFSPAALPEVPLAATVDGIVVSGTVDRLLVTDNAITVVDFKTSRRPPQSADAIPVAIQRQMAAYVAALEVIYPGRTVRAAVLYTQTPQLFELTPEQLAAQKKHLGDAQESYAPLNLDAY